MDGLEDGTGSMVKMQLVLRARKGKQASSASKGYSKGQRDSALGASSGVVVEQQCNSQRIHLLNGIAKQDNFSCAEEAVGFSAVKLVFILACA